jgi:hypothetical protein
MHEYAIAGTLHLDHLAALLDSPANVRTLGLRVFQLSSALGQSENAIRAKLDRLISQHEREWRNFVQFPRTDFVCSRLGRQGPLYDAP